MKFFVLILIALFMISCAGDELIDVINSITKDTPVDNLDFSRINKQKINTGTIVFIPEDMSLNDALKFGKTVKNLEKTKNLRNKYMYELNVFCDKLNETNQDELDNLVNDCKKQNINVENLKGLTIDEILMRNQIIEAHYIPLVQFCENIFKDQNDSGKKILFCKNTELDPNELATMSGGNKKKLDSLEKSLKGENYIKRNLILSEYKNNISNQICSAYSNSITLYKKCMDPDKKLPDLVGMTDEELIQRSKITEPYLEEDKKFAVIMTELEDIIGPNQVLSLGSNSNFYKLEDNSDKIMAVLEKFSSYDYRSDQGDIEKISFDNNGGVLEWTMLDKGDPEKLSKYYVRAECSIKDNNIFSYSGKVPLKREGKVIKKGIIKFSGTLGTLKD